MTAKQSVSECVSRGGAERITWRLALLSRPRLLSYSGACRPAFMSNFLTHR